MDVPHFRTGGLILSNIKLKLITKQGDYDHVDISLIY
jgi:hypothetical protein